MPPYRVVNFNPGPASLPMQVLDGLSQALCNWDDTGMGIMEVSHRSKEVISLLEETVTSVRKVGNISDDYHVLFLNDGASRQFSMVPRNLRRDKNSADYIKTGYWSQKAIEEGRKILGIAETVCNRNGLFYIPEQHEIAINHDAAYVHYTANETIDGLEFFYVPETGNVPLVADMSSNVFSKPIDIHKHGLIYAGWQKNLGPAGGSLVIVRKDLVGHAPPETPATEDYAVHVANQPKGGYNTLNVIGILAVNLYVHWIQKLGGLEAMAERNSTKSKLLYGFFDGSSFFRNNVDPRYRSRMNVPFALTEPNVEKRTKLEKTFLAEAAESGIVGLEGHRSVGAFRASIYNGVSLEDVKKLVSFMEDFKRKHA